MTKFHFFKGTLSRMPLKKGDTNTSGIPKGN
ncbi:hypothetical protein DFO62_102517 [Serratia fonticola]|nr:hypothetical protein DFO62_102517 [Serratia fonticola]